MGARPAEGYPQDAQRQVPRVERRTGIRHARRHRTAVGRDHHAELPPRGAHTRHPPKPTQDQAQSPILVPHLQPLRHP